MASRHSKPEWLILSTALGPLTGEADILRKIVTLDIVMVRHYLMKISSAKQLSQITLRTVEARLQESWVSTKSTVTLTQRMQFLKWLEQLFAVKNAQIDLEPDALMYNVRWAQEAKRYLEFMRYAFPQIDHDRPQWMSSISELSRYSLAAKALVGLAVEFPALFNPMTVKTVVACSAFPFTASQGSPLRRVLRRIIGAREEDYVARLGRIWSTESPEAYFAQACSLDLVAHAEMQLLGFYGNHPEYKPTFRFIGVSKGSCYLCNMFLAAHPEGFGVSSCHQKLYPGWSPPISANSVIYKLYKSLASNLSRTMETTAKQELESRLGQRRRVAPVELTSGPSVSALKIPAMATMITPHPRQPDHSSGNMAGGKELTAECRIGQPTSSSIEVVDHTQQHGDFTELVGMVNDAYIPDESGLAQIVFHFIRANDTTRQDIICMREVICPSTHSPLWVKLIEILKKDDGFGIAFECRHDFLMVNDKIRVGSERQFLACLQYLYNMNIWSSEVIVYSSKARGTT